MKNKIYLLLITAFLFSCTSKESISSIVSSEEENFILTDEILNSYKEGYKLEAKVKTGTDAIGYSYNYNDVSSTSEAYEVTVYSSSTDENCTKNSISNKVTYVPYKYNLKTVISEFELGFDNTIKYYPLVDSSSNFLNWSSTGYENQFNLLSVSDFTFDENEKTYSLNMNSKKLKSFYSSFPTQLTSSIGYEMDEFKVTVKNDKLDTFYVKLKDMQTNYGIHKGEVTGKFIDNGKQVINLLTPLQGEEDEEFTSMMNKLKKQNYHLDVSLASRKYKADVEDGKSIIYDIYSRDDKKTDSYGYYQVKTDVVQGITKLNNNVYYDGSPLNGNLETMLPAFTVSSLFFDKEIDGNKKIYHLKENVPCTIYAHDFGVFNTSDIGDLSFIIENDTLTIENKMRLSTEILEYTNINQIKSTMSSLKQTCDDINWSDLISNQEKESEILYKVISKEELDNLPTFGDTISHVILDASYNPKRPVFVFYLDDFDIANAYKENYEKKLLENGFILQENASIKDATLYQKEIETSNGKVILCAELLVSYEFFKTLQFLIYPYVIK